MYSKGQDKSEKKGVFIIRIDSQSIITGMLKYKLVVNSSPVKKFNNKNL